MKIVRVLISSFFSIALAVVLFTFSSQPALAGGWCTKPGECPHSPQGNCGSGYCQSGTVCCQGDQPPSTGSPPPSTGGSKGLPDGASSGCCSSTGQCTSWFGSVSVCNKGNGACSSGKQCNGGSPNGGTCTEKCNATDCHRSICNGAQMCDGGCKGACGNHVCESNNSETYANCPSDCNPPASSSPGTGTPYSYTAGAGPACTVGSNSGQLCTCRTSETCVGTLIGKTSTGLNCFSNAAITCRGTGTPGGNPGDVNTINNMVCNGTVCTTGGSLGVTCANPTATLYYCPGGLSGGKCLSNRQDLGQIGTSVNLSSLAGGRTCGAIQVDFGAAGTTEDGCGAATYVMGGACSSASTPPTQPPSTQPPSSTPPSSNPPFVCLSITKDIANPTFGQSVRFTCGAESTATSYQFQYKVGTKVGTIDPLTAASNITQPFPITEVGSYKVQCRPCKGTTCTAWVENWSGNATGSATPTASPTPSTNAFTSSQTDSDTVALWHLDETSGTGAFLTDSSGNGLNASASATVTYSSKGMNGSRSFNGTTSFVTLPNSSLFDLQQMTISAWIYPTNLTQQGFIFERGPLNTQYSCFLYGGLVYWRTYAGTTPNDLTVSTSTLKANAWNHVACVYDGTNKIIYLNGKVAISKPYSAVITTGRANERFGSDASPAARHIFLGLLDEVRVDKVGRSAADILGAYQYGKAHQQ